MLQYFIPEPSSQRWRLILITVTQITRCHGNQKTPPSITLWNDWLFIREANFWDGKWTFCDGNVRNGSMLSPIALFLWHRWASAHPLPLIATNSPATHKQKRKGKWASLIFIRFNLPTQASNSFSWSIKTAAGVRNAFSFDGTQIYDIPPAKIAPRGELFTRFFMSSPWVSMCVCVCGRVTS